MKLMIAVTVATGLLDAIPVATSPQDAPSPEVLDSARMAASDHPASDTAYIVNEVDEPVQVRSCPHPDYPRSFANNLRMERVNLRYIVDTLGYAEPASIHLVGRKPPVAFLDPAVDTIRRCRFKPAKRGGQRVRQLVQQAVVFYPPGTAAPPQVGEMPWE